MVMDEQKIDDDELESMAIEVEQQNSYEDDEFKSYDHDSFSSGSEFDDASPLEVPFFITLSLSNDMTMHICMLSSVDTKCVCEFHMLQLFSCVCGLQL